MGKENWEKKFCEKCDRETTHRVDDNGVRCWACASMVHQRETESGNSDSAWKDETSSYSDLKPKIERRFGNFEELEDDFKCKIHINEDLFFETSIPEDQVKSIEKDPSKRMSVDGQRGYCIDNPISHISLDGSIGFEWVTLSFDNFGHIHLNKENFLALKKSIDWMYENMNKSGWDGTKSKNDDCDKLEELKKDIEMLKFSIPTTAGMAITADKFKEESWGHKEALSFKNEWEKLREKLEDSYVI